jgi:phage tail sheath gpL-like
MVDANVITRTVGVSVVYENMRTGTIARLPQRIAVLGQGEHDVSYTTTPRRVTSSAEVGSRYGWRSPLYLMARELFNQIPDDGVGATEVTIYPLQEGASSAPAAGGIVPSGTASRAASFQVVANGIKSEKFVVAAGEVVAATVIAAMIVAVNAVVHMPLVATDGTTTCTLTSSWEGVSANGLRLSVIGDTDAGVEFAITQPTGGLVNPDISTALGLFGTRHETMVLNQMEYNDTTTLGLLQTAGEARWGELVKMPFVAFTGNTVASRATATATSAARRTDRINAYLVAPGAAELPFVVAAAQLAKIARVANNSPAVGYGAIPVPSLTPGTDAQQWDHTARDAAKSAGCSTSVVVDGVMQINDVVTFYRPTGEEPPAYREVVQIIKLMNAIYNLNLVFSSREWAAAPLLPDSSITALPQARKPKSAKAAVLKVLTGLEAEAIITSAKASFKATTAGIDGSNPDRLNIDVPFMVSGNSHVKAITVRWGFNFGQA